jgi:hypothetical protein
MKAHLPSARRSRRAAVRRVLLVIDVVVLAVVVALAVTGQLSTKAVNPPPPIAPMAAFTRARGLPPNATCPVVYTDVAKPFNAGARGTPMTSCPFVEQVRRAFALQNPGGSGTQAIRAVSPTTHRAYDMVCTAEGAYATCVGGQGAIVYLYNNS